MLRLRELIVYVKSQGCEYAQLVLPKLLPIESVWVRFIKTSVQSKWLNMFKCVYWPVRDRSQIPLYGLTGRAMGGRSAAPGRGILRAKSWKKYVPCVGTIYE